ncbi:hypothetical protein B0H14DRAFT_3856322 [Mycena olivaceomarginata]|nr:hypothetical protein B0H14DRAFT_3856322 [Mycena olivaceomarginata]
MAPGDRAKADQIAFHIYTKLFHVLYAARASDQGQGTGKTDKWVIQPRDAARPTRRDAHPRARRLPRTVHRSSVLTTFGAAGRAGPPRRPAPGGGTALVHTPSGTRIEPEPRYVLLEEWMLALIPSTSTSASTSASTSSAASTSTASSTAGSGSTSSSDTSVDEDTAVLPPTIYKNAIPLFRALYALLRNPPRVARQGFGQGGGQGGGGGGRRGLKVVVRLRPPDSTRRPQGGGNGDETTLAFGDSPAFEAGVEPLATSGHTFPGVGVPGGTLALSATYLTAPAFSLESLEALLSSRFAVLDARGPAPALARFSDGAGRGGEYAPPRFGAGGSGSSRREFNAYTPGLVSTREYTPSPRSGSRREPLGEYGSFGRRTSTSSGYPLQQQDEDEGEDEEFVPTLARRSITTSTTSSAGGMAMGSPGRYSSPLPPVGGSGMSASPGRYNSPLPNVSSSPGRYNSSLPPVSGSPGRYTSALRPRVDSLRSVSASGEAGGAYPASPIYGQHPHRTISESRASSSSSYRDVPSPGPGSRNAPYRDAPSASPSSASSASYRMGVHVAAGPGQRREFARGRGRGGPLRAAAERGVVAVEHHHHWRGAGARRERDRERERGVPIGGGGGTPSSLGGAAGGYGPGPGPGAGSSLPGGSGSSSSAGAGISGSRPIAINPFKSNTLSRSSLSGSLLRGVGGGGVAGSPGRGSGSGATSPMGVAFPAYASPSPAPPPSGESGSLSGANAGSGASGSGAGAGVGIPVTRKRYSSSFPHRYAGSVGSGGSGESGSVGVAGSGPPPGSVPRERTASMQSRGGSHSRGGSRSGSFLKSPVDADTDAQHDDISTFVKDIDAARPLLGRYRQQQDEPPGPSPDPELDADDSTGSSSPGTSRGGTVRGAGSTVATLRTGGTLGPSTLGPGASASTGAPPAQAMLTSVDEVDARLRSMNEEFMRSLVGLGGAGRGRGSPVSLGSGSGLAGSGAGSGSGSGSGGQGSEEVLGRLEFG